MKTILDQTEYESIIDRINKLSPDTKGLWGKMTVNEMICHASDIIRDILGIRQTEPMTPPEMRPQIIAMVLTENEWDKNLQTFPPYIQEEGGGGTKPANFETDKKTFLDLIARFYMTSADYKFSAHAGLGILSREQFGCFVWKHTDHHLREFGV